MDDNLRSKCNVDKHDEYMAVLPADEWGRSGSVFSGLPFSPCLFGINLDLELFLVDEVVWDP